MVNKRVLYFDADEASGRIGERAVVAAGCDVLGVRSEAALATVDLRGYDAVFLATTREALAADRLGGVLDRIGGAVARPEVVIVAPEGAGPLLGALTSYPAIGHVLAAPEPRVILGLARMIVDHASAGIERHLPWGAEVLRLPVSDSRAKISYVGAASTFAGRLGCPGRVIERVETVVDELTTNAIFNAPRDPGGQPRFAHLSRRFPVGLPAGEAGELAFGCDGETFVIAQRDPFGSLERRVVLDHLSRCLQKGPGELLASGGGAGLGLFRCYSSSSRMVFSVRPRQWTEVVVLIDLRASVRQFKIQPKSLHFFLQET
jgi:hypothetical protein